MTSQESSSKINEALKNTLNEFLKFPLSEAMQEDVQGDFV
jgi:hypothetical protein